MFNRSGSGSDGLVVGVWLTARCPVREEEQTWIERSLQWLTEQFGEEVLHGPVVLPTDAYPPGRCLGTRDDVARLLDLLRVHMALDAERVELEFVEDDAGRALRHHLPECHGMSECHGLPECHGMSDDTGRRYRQRGGPAVIAIRRSQLRDPVALVAAIAHELGNERLLGEERVSPARPDHESLADLLTVFFGLGIFTANAAGCLRDRPTVERPGRLGHLTEPMFGYALAYYTWLRRDPRPSWSRHLDTNLRGYLTRGLRYLGRR